MTTPAVPADAATANTAPAETAVAPALPPAAPPDGISAEEAVVALLAAYVAARTASAAVRATLTPTRIVAALVQIGIPRRVARATLRLALEAGVRVPGIPTGPGTQARRAVARTEPIWRARYLMAAAKRMGRAYLDPPRRPGQRTPRALTVRPDSLLPGVPATPGQRGITPWAPERMTPAEAARHAFELERRYLAQHRAAQANRKRAAKAVDLAAARHGQVLGWYSVRDARTTWDCLRMHGKNFHTAEPPAGHLPGSVHPRCRCTPGPPWPGARIVGGTGA